MVAAVRESRIDAPGIGVSGEIVINNNNTRAVLVAGEIISSHDKLGALTKRLLSVPQPVTRRLLKGVTTIPLAVGTPLEDPTCIVEGSIPFSSDQGDNLFWLVAGKNTGDREPDHELMNRQRLIIDAVRTDGRYVTQTTEDLIRYVRAANKDLVNFRLVQITSDNVNGLTGSIAQTYIAAFDQYPYDVAETIATSCDVNLFVAALNDEDQVLSITGAEFINVGGLSIAEIGDSASLPHMKGFGPLMKRFLLQKLVETDRVPSLCFTDSRVAFDGAVLKANRRAGFQLDGIMLPWHTVISSKERDPAVTREIHTSDGPRRVENMTMTWINRDSVHQVLSQYGTIRN